MGWKRWAARLACVLLLAGAVQPFYFRMLTSYRTHFGRYAEALPYQKTPGLVTFMKGVRERTAEGDRIAVLVPMQRWDGGYAYAFTRSNYLLSGRRAVPLIGADDRAMPGNLDQSNFIAAWHLQPAVTGFKTVWRSADGVLLRRTR